MAAQTTFINSMLDSAFTGTFIMHLYTTGLPSATGVEVSGGGYTAQTLTFSAASNKVKALTSNVTFSNLPLGSVIVAYGITKTGTLVDEGMLSSSYIPDVTNNSLTVGYSFNLSGT